MIASKPKHVLVIDDAPVMRQKIAMALRSAGFEVTEAGSGQEGLDLALSHIPDLILLDLRMPEMDGFEVQRRIRTHDDLQSIPVIFLTAIGKVNIVQIQESLNYGISDYIAKPFKLSKLVKKVRSVLEV